MILTKKINDIAAVLVACNDAFFPQNEAHFHKDFVVMQLESKPDT